METSSKKITGEIQLSKDKLQELKGIKSLKHYQNKIEENLFSSTTELLAVILGGAIALAASDIHIEPEEERVKIRIRIDGVLEDVIFFEHKIYRGLVSRLKLLSGLKLNISDRPQDGRFSIEMPDKTIEIRSSSLPAEYGEAIVMRILDPSSLIEIEALGLRKDLYQIVDKELKRPNGMIVVTGPTGSGKTTTLYAFCLRIRKPEIKIITIENPIEYHLEGISQTQVDPGKGYDFASGLKSIMRQDPDVILVGEIRDKKTVNTALQAALTGHLVLTTLHTNDAAGVVARLISLGGKISNIGPAINMVIAQRLVRKVCQQCKKMEKVSKQELEKIKKELAPLKNKVDLPKLDASLKIAKPTGCDYCNSTGYRGRIGIFEVFLVDEEIESFIVSKPSIAALRKLAIKKGMTLMKEDGFYKVVQGITTIEEVERVTGE